MKRSRLNRTACCSAFALALCQICNSFTIHSSSRMHHPRHHRRRSALFLSSEEIQARLVQRMTWLREKDRLAPAIEQKDLKIVHEDHDLIVIDKPSGVLCVPSEPGVHSIAQTVFDYCRENDDTDVKSMHQMVVHRLGCDTAGLLVFCKTVNANRGMNAIFRTRKITRQYEVLVAGHVEQDQGLINLPLMRCYECPPYMRISTDEHQRQLVHLDANIVGKQLLQAPKASLTHYQVMRREEYQGNVELPVTRMTLTSMTGRTHQLNVHCAAVGHPIVRDTVYGYQGSAVPNGGLHVDLLPKDRASLNLQKALATAARESAMCVQAKLIRFCHPTTGLDVEFTSTPSF